MSDQTTSLETMLDHTPTPAPEPQPIAAPEPGPAQQGESAAPPAAPVIQERESEPAVVPRKALEDERRKRQDYERRMEELERTLQEIRQPKQQPQAQPDWLLDPEAAARAQHEAFSQQIWETRVELSQEAMRARHPDYDEMEAVFRDIAARDPSLVARMKQSAVPAKFAYDTAKRIKWLQEVSDPNALEAKLEEKFLQKYGLKPGGQPQPQSHSPVAMSPVPRSLARSSSQQPRTERGTFAAKEGPTPLEDIID